MLAPVMKLAGGDERVLVGPGTSDDAGVYLLDGRALVATADFITPVCDDPVRFGRVAAANSLSDVYAMGGEPIFALNLCCFPEKGLPPEAVQGILEGAASTVSEASAAVLGGHSVRDPDLVLGGHSVRDPDLKFGLAVVGVADPDRLLTNAAAQTGDRLILTKPLGTGILINAFRKDKLDEAAFEPALAEMERLNGVASRLALEHGAHAATDVTGFGLAGHALEVASASGVGLQIAVKRLPVHDGFFDMLARGVTTGATRDNIDHVAPKLVDETGLDEPRRELLHDPQTSGGLLLSVPPESVEPLLAALERTGHRAVEIGEVVPGPARLVIV